MSHMHNVVEDLMWTDTHIESLTSGFLSVSLGDNTEPPRLRITVDNKHRIYYVPLEHRGKTFENYLRKSIAQLEELNYE